MKYVSFGLTALHFSGFQDESSTKSSSQQNLAGSDPWSTCLFGFLEKNRVLSCCPTAVIHSWPIVFARINSLFTVIDPTYVSSLSILLFSQLKFYTYGEILLHFLLFQTCQ